MKQAGRWPDFLILGAAKCGTTSLYHYLKAHPDVFLPEFKEPTFFASEAHALVKGEAEYLGLFENSGGARLVGEASVGYLYYPESPGMILERLGLGVRMIALVRNPVEMMYSAWAHRIRVGDETREAREALLASFDGPWGDRPAYADLASFAGQLERYFALFPKERIKVLAFEEFFRPGLPLYAELCGFLGVNEGHPPVAEVYNKGALVPRSRALHRFISSYYGRFVAPVATRLMPTGVRHAVRRRLERWNSEGGTAIPPLGQELRSELEQRLNSSVRALEALLERDLSDLWFGQTAKRAV